MQDQRYELLYQEALRAVADQPSAVDSVQSRAGLVASAGAVSLSLAATQATLSSAWSWAVLAAFLTVVVLVAWILWPRGSWRFNFDVDYLVWEYIEGPAPLREDLIKRDLALHLGRNARANAVQIDRLGRGLAGAILALLVETTLIALSFLGGS
jgi:hypothetical protein